MLLPLHHDHAIGAPLSPGHSPGSSITSSPRLSARGEDRSEAERDASSGRTAKPRASTHSLSLPPASLLSKSPMPTHRDRGDSVIIKVRQEPMRLSLESVGSLPPETVPGEESGSWAESRSAGDYPAAVALFQSLVGFGGTHEWVPPANVDSRAFETALQQLWVRKGRGGGRGLGRGGSDAMTEGRWEGGGRGVGRDTGGGGG